MRIKIVAAICGLAATFGLAAPAAAADGDTTHIRLAGANRYETAVAISKYAFVPQFPGDDYPVTVASGADFPDALAAGPLAAAEGGPLLLVPRDGALPSTVRGELSRLGPLWINIAGGAGAVSSLMESQLKDYEEVYRLYGKDRYETAVDLAVETGAFDTTVFIATGSSFPDALGGSAAAGRLGGSLMLTRRTALPADTALLLEYGQPAKVVVLGGTGVVDTSVVREIQRIVPGAKVERWAGSDRYETTAAISRKTYPQGADTVYLASGADYPDALAGAPVAALEGAPLLLTRKECVPAATKAEITRLGATNVVVLGGTGVVSNNAAKLRAC
ncbi:putative cell wall-binding protein [Georgenia soli]|uniref:Putative cell wall-binding protein n=1 Tax=Georgenia soli TaxID=638953 RepID=A0A2A9EK85_9MICO|nr:cell wall-binding repeat-containing protein [Georgenia soli]PFG38672.1 putative cell wall-binding protein [Georgenia soli]